MTKVGKQQVLVDALRTLVLTPSAVVIELPVELREMVVSVLEKEAKRFRRAEDPLTDLGAILDTIHKTVAEYGGEPWNESGD